MKLNDNEVAALSKRYCELLSSANRFSTQFLASAFPKTRSRKILKIIKDVRSGFFELENLIDKYGNADAHKILFAAKKEIK